MAKTEYVTVKGKTKYFRHNTLDTAFGGAKWKHVMYPDSDSLATIKQLKERGLKNILKKDEDGYYMNFSRPSEILLKTGQRAGLRAPDVFKFDGKTPWGDTVVGNGSDVTTKLEVYTCRRGKPDEFVAVRWLSSVIDSLVPYDDKRDMTEQEAISAEGLDKRPPHKWD